MITVKYFIVVFSFQISISATSMEAIGFSEDGMLLGETASTTSEAGHKRDILLIQKLLAKTTQPSPMKAMFSVEELEAAALAVSQYLVRKCLGNNLCRL